MSTETFGTHHKPVIVFDLSEYDWAFRKFFEEAVHALMICKSPLLERIKSSPSEIIPTSRNTTPSGQVVENPPIETWLDLPRNFTDAQEGNFDSVTEAAAQAAEKATETVTLGFLRYASRLSEAFGTAIDAHGQPLSHRLLTQFLDTQDLDFDDQGDIDLSPYLIYWNGRGLDFEEIISALPPRTPDETTAWSDMVERKRRLFNDRKRHRKLS